jgi:hypothetical protein
MKIKFKYLLLLLICLIYSILSFAQNTVHLSIIEEGRGVLRSRGNECFVITPKHVIEGAELRTITITGENQKSSTGKFIKSYPGDIAIIKIENGAAQECSEWDIRKSFSTLLQNTFEGYLETRNDDGSFDHEPMYLKKKTDQGITIQAKDNAFEFSKGMSGSSLFSNINGVKTYLGMLLSTDNSKLGNVFQADDMDRIVSEFFTESQSITNLSKIEQSNKSTSTKSYEEEGFKYELIKSVKNGDNIKLSFLITSLVKDDINYLRRQGTKIYNQQGTQIEASSIKLANQNDINYGGWNFTFPKGVPIPYEVNFTGCEDFEQITLLELIAKDSKLYKFKNIELEGASRSTTSKVLTPIKSFEEEGFRYELIKSVKNGDNIKLSFQITSLLKDDINYLRRQGTKIYNQQGIQIESSSIKLANQNDINYGGWNFTFPKGVPIPYEVNFTGCEDFEQITLLELIAKDSKLYKFKNIKIE